MEEKTKNIIRMFYHDKEVELEGMKTKQSELDAEIQRLDILCNVLDASGINTSVTSKEQIKKYEEAMINPLKEEKDKLKEELDCLEKDIEEFAYNLHILAQARIFANTKWRVTE